MKQSINRILLILTIVGTVPKMYSIDTDKTMQEATARYPAEAERIKREGIALYEKERAEAFEKLGAGIKGLALATGLLAVGGYGLKRSWRQTLYDPLHLMNFYVAFFDFGIPYISPAGLAAIASSAAIVGGTTLGVRSAQQTSQALVTRFTDPEFYFKQNFKSFYDTQKQNEQRQQELQAKIEASLKQKEERKREMQKTLEQQQEQQREIRRLKMIYGIKD